MSKKVKPLTLVPLVLVLTAATATADVISPSLPTFQHEYEARSECVSNSISNLQPNFTDAIDTYEDTDFSIPPNKITKVKLHIRSVQKGLPSILDESDILEF